VNLCVEGTDQAAVAVDDCARRLLSRPSNTAAGVIEIVAAEIRKAADGQSLILAWRCLHAGGERRFPYTMLLEDRW
jgi:hypothetical protein